MFKSNKSRVIGAVVAGSLLFGGGIGSGVAVASGSSLKVQTVNETLYNGRCYHYTSTSIAYYHWVKKAGAYVPYSSPHVTHVDRDMIADYRERAALEAPDGR